MAPPLDQDWLFLDKIISLSDDVVKLANAIKEDSDDPLVLQRAMHLESNALLIWKLARDYRPRLELLKTLADGNGLKLFGRIAKLAEEIKTVATGPPPNNHKKTSGSPPHTASLTNNKKGNA